MDKIEMLNNINLVVHELTESIKKQCIEDEIIKNENIKNLDKYIKKFNRANTSEFNSSHSIGWLKCINILLLDIVKHQDKRITLLEDKLNAINLSD